MCELALNLVHEKGYYVGIVNEFLKRTESLYIGDQQSLPFRKKIEEIFYEEEHKLPAENHYLGSSEVIESLFGKFKALEGIHASSGLTSLVLAVPALVGTLNNAMVEEALNTICVEDVDDWVENEMGQTFHSRRRCALSRNREGGGAFDLELCD